MDVGRLIGDRLRNHVGHEAHDGGILVDDLLFLLLGFGRDVALVAIVE